MSNCTKCHELGEAVINAKCLDCHKEINSLIKSSGGFHGNPANKTKNCFECHSEHHGRNFQIIRFDESGFNHSQAQYDLIGKHKNLDCSKCHNKENIADEELKNKSKTFLGLSAQCSACHTDPHRGTLGNSCENCHGNEKFAPAEFFDHGKTKFALSGAHVNLQCEKCHQLQISEGNKFQKFSGIKFESCTSCHKDIHNGKFGVDCSKCHTIETFKTIKNMESFNHALTAFPLIGKHQNIQCESCHKKGFTVKLKHQFCIDCHKDFHEGQFGHVPDKIDCKNCHAEYGFSHSLYTIEQHNLGNYVLTGSHLAIPCAGCHSKNDKWIFKYASTECISCHANVHGNTISQKYFGNNECIKCHSTDSWQQVKFDHEKTGFVISGKHAILECGACHFKGNSGGITEHKFSSLTQACESCHEDVHNGQFIEGGLSNCSRCHTSDNWNPLNFDHNNTGFKLDGAHSNLECYMCHKTVTINSKKYIQYKFEEIKCSNCHS